MEMTIKQLFPAPDEEATKGLQFKIVMVGTVLVKLCNLYDLLSREEEKGEQKVRESSNLKM